MHAGEIVVNEVESDRSRVVLHLFAEGVREAYKAAHPHPHGEVLTLHKVGADVLRIRRSVIVFMSQPMQVPGLYRLWPSFEAP